MMFGSTRHRTLLVPMALVMLCASCVSLGGPSGRVPLDTQATRRDIVVASFNFSESELLAEMYATVLEDQGYPVTRLINLGSRETVLPALFQDHVDLVPEYLGTALAFATLGQSNASSDTGAMADKLAAALQPEGVSVTQPSPAQDQNGVVVTRETATSLGLDSISDLQDGAADLVFGGPPECPERPLCLKGLEDRYGLSFKSFLPLDESGPATVSAIEEGEVDVALLFTTDPDIAAHDLVLLKDDRGLQPAENVVPIIRSQVVERYGRDLTEAIQQVTRRLSTSHLRALNRKIELGERDPGEVAREWLEGQGVIS
jgi:osmoprotectant transport system substrate-binding protein